MFYSSVGLIPSNLLRSTSLRSSNLVVSKFRVILWLLLWLVSYVLLLSFLIVAFALSFFGVFVLCVCFKTISGLLWLLSDIICGGIFGYCGYCSHVVVFRITVIFCFWLYCCCFAVWCYGVGYYRYYRYLCNG